MWEAVFDISMLKGKNIIVSCPDEALAEEFMSLLAENGIKWSGDGSVPRSDHSTWDDYEQETCYWIENGILSYGDRSSVEEYANDWSGHIKCTFCGVDTPDFDTATDDEVLSLFDT